MHLIKINLKPNLYLLSGSKPNCSLKCMLYNLFRCLADATSLMKSNWTIVLLCLQLKFSYLLSNRSQLYQFMKMCLNYLIYYTIFENYPNTNSLTFTDWRIHIIKSVLLFNFTRVLFYTLRQQSLRISGLSNNTIQIGFCLQLRYSPKDGSHNMVFVINEIVYYIR